MGVSLQPSLDVEAARKKMKARMLSLSLSVSLLLITHLAETKADAEPEPDLVALATFGALGLVFGLGTAGGLAVGNALINKKTGRRGRREVFQADKRESREILEEVKQKVERLGIEMLPLIEVEDCYKRLICKAKAVPGSNEAILSLLPVRGQTVSQHANKFAEAARYGEVRANVDKCEHRYTCTRGI